MYRERSKAGSGDTGDQPLEPRTSRGLWREADLRLSSLTWWWGRTCGQRTPGQKAPHESHAQFLAQILTFKHSPKCPILRNGTYKERERTISSRSHSARRVQRK